MSNNANTKTIAETFGDELNGDGTQFATDAGEQWSDLLKRYGADKAASDHEQVRWEFSDGSSIVEAGDAWDLGLAGGCFCWAGAEYGRHHERCTARWLIITSDNTPNYGDVEHCILSTDADAVSDIFDDIGDNWRIWLSPQPLSGRIVTGDLETVHDIGSYC